MHILEFVRNGKILQLKVYLLEETYMKRRAYIGNRTEPANYSSQGEEYTININSLSKYYTHINATFLKC